MCRGGRFWTMRQYAGFADAEESATATSSSSNRARLASRSPSISRRRSGTTRMTRSPARWERWASPSRRSPTWRP
ncbi:MAG: hypothetical protein U0360_10790 [Dehalococcoidia bacterium]